MTELLAFPFAEQWQAFWQGQIGDWILTRGLKIVLLMIGGLLAARFISWLAGRISRRIDDGFRASDALVRSERAKHRQAVASVISYLAIALLAVLVFIEVTDVLEIPVGSLVGPAAVLGAALGFGAQRLVQDLLSGFFIITERQYGIGDLIEVTMGTSGDAMGTVEDITLRVTKLRTAEGELYTIANGQIIKTLNLSNQWARAAIDIPVPATADLGVIDDVLDHVCEAAPLDPLLRDLLLDKPQMMGVESILLDTVNLRMVARTLPGKQFEVGRRLRLLVAASLAKAGIATTADSGPMVGAVVRPATAGGAETPTQGPVQ